jgi:hypothetical protein
MPDRLFDVSAWLDLAATRCKQYDIPVRFASKVALVLFETWRERDPDCGHWLEHCDEDQLIAMCETVTEWLAFAQNFPDLPQVEARDEVAELERGLREAS